MINLTGDTHGEWERFSELSAQGEENWTDKDYLIVLGDFGYAKEENKERLDKLEREKKYTICFCDGNHENFEYINFCPIEMWNGGEVHRIRKNIIHLKRGQVYKIDGKVFFVFGGGYSRDRWRREKNVSYWEEEMPCDEEYKVAIESLKKVNFKVDYIITHTAPREAIYRMGCIPDPHEQELNGFLDWVMYETEFKQWFFGHWHRQQTVEAGAGKHLRAMYFDVAEIKE